MKKRLGLDRCRLLAAGGAPLSDRTFDYFLGLDIALLACYGLSENTGPHGGNRPWDIK